MSFGKISLVLLAGVLSAQVVPDWFVVELTQPTVGRTRGARQVRESQTAARAALTSRLGSRVEVKDFTEVVMNSLIVRSTAGEAALAAVPGVRRVWPVYEIHPELDRAVGLIQAAKAWEAVGGADRAGAGMKIGILDSGLDLTHPGFKTDALTAPDSYPRATNEDIRAQLNGKVIVYRTYEQMAGFTESALDNSGHGTGVAMAAAGVRVKSPKAELQGVAPAAHLGVYKIFVGPNGASSSTAIATKAIDDAAADGMDVLNISWGFLPQIRPEIDPLSAAVARAASLGIAVIKSNGNSGPGRLTGSTPTVGTNGLTVGSAWTDRIFASGVRVNGGASVYAIPGDGPAPDAPINAPLKDVAPLDSTGLACAALPPGSLSGTIALILRGDCTFEVKLRVAENAGAVAAIVYTHTVSPNASGMAVGTSQLPSVMISNRDGVAIKATLAAAESTAEIAFGDTLPFLIDANGISDFSSRGPGADGSIRPDVVAIGEELLTAAQKNNPNGEIYDASGYAAQYGTSFASPLVAGAYAVLKAGRPGLTSSQYRSLLVNTAEAFLVAPVQEAGAGRLDVHAALRGRLAMEPVSVSFGTGGQRMDVTRPIRVQNVTPNTGTWKVEVASSDDVKATVEPAEFSLGSGDVIDLQVRLSGDVPVGENQGFLLFRPLNGEENERPQRMAYWYGVPSGKPAAATVIPSAPQTAAAGATVTLTVLITDAIGAATPFESPKVTVLEGGGEFITATSIDEFYPGYWQVRLRIGPATGQRNRFRIEAGAAIREVSIQSR